MYLILNGFFITTPTENIVIMTSMFELSHNGTKFASLGKYVI